MVKKRDRKKLEKPTDTVQGSTSSRRTFTFDRTFPVLYAASYALVALVIHLSFFPIGDVGVETDFYGDLVVAAQEIWRGDFSASNYPYKGPVYSFALVFVHMFGGGWYFSAVILNALCAAFSLVIVYRLILRLYNRFVACFTMISVSLVLEFFLQAHKASSDMLFFLLCYSAISLVIMEKLSWFRVMCGAVVGALAFLTRYNGVILPVSAALVFLRFNSCGWSWKRRLSASGLYIAVFVAVCIPWFAVNLRETGSILATRNLESIVKEFYRGANAPRLPEGGFESFSALFLHDPIHFIKHFVSNIPKHFWFDMRHMLGIKTSFLVLLGFLRLLAVPPTRKQWAFLLFPTGIFLAACAVFYLPRFSIPVSPAYCAIGFSFILGSGMATRSRLGTAFERAFAEHVDWLKKDLRGSRVTPGRIAAVIIIVVFFSFQITSIVKSEKDYYDMRPLFIFAAASFLNTQSAASYGGDRPVVMARKPHIAYYSGFAYQTYPQTLSAASDFVTFALKHDVDYIVYSEIERKFYTESDFLMRLETVPGIKKIYTKPEIIIYRLEEWINIRKEAGRNALEGHLIRLREIGESDEYESIIELGSKIASIFAVNGDWDQVERYLLVCLHAAERIAEPETANSYIYSIRRSLSQAYRRLGEHEKGIALLIEDIEFFERRGDKGQLANIHFQLYNHYKELDDKEKALIHLRKSYNLYVSIGNMQNAKAIQGFIEALQNK